jgi:hypothetical protein
VPAGRAGPVLAAVGRFAAGRPAVPFVALGFALVVLASRALAVRRDAARAASTFALGGPALAVRAFPFDAPARRSPPIRVGRVEGRVPSTPASAAFLFVFFPGFSVIR